MAAAPGNRNNAQQMAGGVQTVIIVVLTLIFVVLYILSLIGVLKPLQDDALILRLEPIIFAIIGYYFGRVPGQQNEQTLKAELNGKNDEIRARTEQANNARDDREQVHREKTALDEKLKSTRAALVSAAPETPPNELAPVLASGSGTIPESNVRHSVAAALKILDS